MAKDDVVGTLDQLRLDKTQLEALAWSDCATFAIILPRLGRSPGLSSLDPVTAVERHLETSGSSWQDLLWRYFHVTCYHHLSSLFIPLGAPPVKLGLAD